MDINDINQIARAIRIAEAFPLGREVTEDYKRQLEREHDIWQAETERVTNLTRVNPKTGETVTYKATAVGDAEAAMSPVLREAVDKVTARVLRDRGLKVPVYGQPIHDALTLELLIASGHKVDTTTAEVVFNEDDKTPVMRTAPGELLTDKPSRVVPLTRQLTDSGVTDVKARAIDAPVLGKAYLDSEGKATDEIWQAIASVTENGFWFRDSKGKEVRVPALAAMVSKAFIRAGAQGKAVKPEHIDDVISSSLMRAYLMMRAVKATATESEYVSFSPDAIGTVDVHCPLNETTAGFLVTRNVRCGECAPCRAGWSNRHTEKGKETWNEEMTRAVKASTTDIKSRYSNGKCLSPVPTEDYVDVQRIMQRAIYSEAAAHVSYERYDDTRFATAEEIEEYERTAIAESVPFIMSCGHKNCERRACRVFKAVNASRVIVEALGKGAIGSNGAVSGELMDMVSTLYYPEDSHTSRRHRRGKARALIIEVLSGETGTRTVRRFKGVAYRQAVADAGSQMLARGNEIVATTKSADWQAEARIEALAEEESTN